MRGQIRRIRWAGARCGLRSTRHMAMSMCRHAYFEGGGPETPSKTATYC